MFEGGPLLASATYPPYFVPSTREKVSTKEEDEEGNARSNRFVLFAAPFLHEVADARRDALD